IELEPSWRTTSCSTSSASGMTSSARGAASVSGKRTMKPSSLHIVSTMFRARRRIGVGEADDEAVVAPHRFDVDLQLVAHLRRDRHRPRRVDAAAERREDADAPVAEVVENALDDDGAIVGNGAG